jgi:hypothetical protein
LSGERSQAAMPRAMAIAASRTGVRIPFMFVAARRST